MALVNVRSRSLEANFVQALRLCRARQAKHAQDLKLVAAEAQEEAAELILAAPARRGNSVFHLMVIAVARMGSFAPRLRILHPIHRVPNARVIRAPIRLQLDVWLAQHALRTMGAGRV